MFFGVVLSFQVIASQSLEQLTPQEAYEQGKLLRWQYHIGKAKEYIKYAADKGHADASYMYAEMSSTNPFVQQKLESEYAVRAAKLGNVDGILKASRSFFVSSEDAKFFKNEAYAMLLEQIEAGDAEAMYRMASVYDNDNDQMEWVEKAANAGSPRAMTYLAKRYENDTYGTFFISGNREKEYQRLYRQAAEAGYPPAMGAYAYILSKTPERRSEAFDWMLKGAEIGKAQSLTFLAGIYSRNDEMRDVVPYDSVKAAGYYKAYFAVMGDESDKELYDIHWNIFKSLLKTMTSEEREKADKFADDYLSTHTVRAFDDFWEWGVDYGEKPN